MTPGARVATCVELLARLETPPLPAADRLLDRWGRQNRYAGAGDRRDIAAMLYGVLRHRGQIDWWRAKAATETRGGEGENQAGTETVARARLLVWLMRGKGLDGPTLTAMLHNGGRYGAPPLTAAEEAWLPAVAGSGLDHPDQPAAVRGNLPPWLASAMADLYGDDAGRQLAAYDHAAAVDLRVNLLCADRERMLESLRGDGAGSDDAQPTPFSPMGIRLAGRRPLKGMEFFRNGQLELQDEGAQLAAILCDARPGMRVLDICAGGGGKTLALAACMANKGHISAWDIAPERLARAKPRLQRAGVVIAECQHLSDAESDSNSADAAATGMETETQTAPYDRVLADVPCSGSGVWRRNPERRWQIDADMLSRLQGEQAALLHRAGHHVAPGGRLIYAACSWLREEGEVPIAHFLANHPDFTVLPVATVWEQVLKTPCPVAQGDGFLRLTPADHGTDGFFIAILSRRN